jgi:hypothetical protein
MAFVMRFQPDLLSNALTERRLIDYLNLRQRKDHSSTIENGLSFPFQKFIGKVPRQHEIIIRLQRSLSLRGSVNVDAFSIALEFFQQVIEYLAIDINTVLKVAVGFICITARGQIFADAVCVVLLHTPGF